MADKIVIELETELNEAQVKSAFKKLEQIAAKSGDEAGEEFSDNFGDKASGGLNVTLGKSLTSLTAKVATLAAGLASAFVGRSILKAGVTIERLETQFGVLLRSTAAAQKQIEELSEFAATTPFQLEGLAEATAQLLSFGFESDTIIDRLKVIGDVAAGSNSDLKEVALIFGQIRAAGKLTGERLLQLQERAIPIGSALAKSLGVAESQVRGLVSAGKIGFAEFEAAFRSLTQAGGLFKGATEKQSQTLGGLLSTLNDNFFALQVAVAKTFGPSFKILLGEAINVVRELTKSFIANSRSILQASITIAKGFNDFIVAPLELVFNSFRSVFNGASALINQFVATSTKKISGFVDDIFKILGQENPFAEQFKLAVESTQEVADDALGGFRESIDKQFEGTIFGKGDEFLSNLQANVDSAKIILDEADLKKIFGGNDDPTETQFESFGVKLDLLSQKAGEFAVNWDKAMKKVANSAVQGLGKGVGAGFSAFGAALVRGEDAIKAFGKAFLASIGQAAVALGTRFILEGVAISFNPLLGGPSVGGPLIAAGAALATFGGALGAVGGGGAGAGGGVGTAAFGEQNVVDPATDQVEEREEPETRNTIVVNGDILDSEDTGRRLLQLINDESLNRGSVITNGAFA